VPRALPPPSHLRARATGHDEAAAPLVGGRGRLHCLLHFRLRFHAAAVASPRLPSTPLSQRSAGQHSAGQYSLGSAQAHAYAYAPPGIALHPAPYPHGPAAIAPYYGLNGGHAAGPHGSYGRPFAAPAPYPVSARATPRRCRVA
jgi:hypothetical protein